MSTSETLNKSDRKLPTRAVCARYDVVDRTLHRWIRDPELGFPKALRINRRMYFGEAELDEWDRAMASKSRVGA